MLASIIFSLIPQAFALKNDTHQPINVLSDKQSLNLVSSQAVFTQNVYITQGSIQIKAQKVVVTQSKDKKSETLDAYGTPVYFQQTLDDGKIVKGSAELVNYDIKNEFVTLIGNAQLHQDDSQIEGRKITYDVKTQQLKADSGETGRRVRTILIPTQLNGGKNAHQPKEETPPTINFNTRAPLTQTSGTQKLRNEKKINTHSSQNMNKLSNGNTSTKLSKE